MTKQQFNKLMDKHLDGSASPEEEQELFEWYDHFQENTASADPLPEEEQSALFAALKTKITVSSSPRIHQQLWFKIAASFALIMLTAGLVFYSRLLSNTDAALIVLTTGNAEKHQTILPDGTLVWVNANSRLDFPAHFTGGRREVWLKGEAYFEVKHDPKKPFIVHTPDMQVKVLGTVFNITAYPERKTEASLIRGSVEVSLNQSQQQKVILKPFQKLVVEKPGGNEVPAVKKNAPVKDQAQFISPAYHLDTIAHSQDGPAIAEIAWIQQTFAFRNERFENMCSVLEKGFGVKINIQDPKIKEYRFTGIFKNASLQTVLDALKFSNKFEYRKEGEKTIIIY